MGPTPLGQVTAQQAMPRKVPVPSLGPHADFTNLLSSVSTVFLQDLAEADAAKESVLEVQVGQWRLITSEHICILHIL